MKKVVLIAITFLSLQACKEEPKEISKELPPIAGIFEAYHEEGLKLNPIGATFQGDARYNDTIPNFLSSEYEKQLREYYSTFKSQLADYSEAELSESEKMSKAIMEWECDINLEGLGFANYTPIDQMWSLNLMIGQLGSGAGAQPFKTVEDYENWLSRLEDYSEWLASAKTKMEEGVKAGQVLPKSLIKKVIPQLASVVKPKLEDNLFYGPVKNFPEDFTEEQKSSLKESYAKMISDKIVPGYKNLHDYVNTEYMEAGRESSGIEGIPNGKKYYEHQINYIPQLK